jgi:hypothetical protein
LILGWREWGRTGDGGQEVCGIQMLERDLNMRAISKDHTNTKKAYFRCTLYPKSPKAESLTIFESTCNSRCYL